MIEVTDEAVDDMARALIAEANRSMIARIGPGPGTNLRLEHMTPEGREHYRRLARAALEHVNARLASQR